MDFLEIRDKYPKAHAVFGEWLFSEKISTSSFSFRDLYDFFDSKGMLVYVCPFNDNEDKTNESKFVGILFWPKIVHAIPSITRKRSEENIFTIAFASLESSL